MNGSMTRKNMIDTFSAMLKPARMIMNISREELSALSGLDETLIEEVETGRLRLQKSHYLALASVFDNAKYQEEENIYRALVRILTPDNEADSDGEAGDFVLVRRWFDTFSGDSENDGGFEEYEELVQVPELAGVNDIYDDEYSDEDFDDEADEDTDEALPGEILSDSELEDLAENCKIFADSSAVSDENFPALITRLEPLLRQADSVIIVPQKAIDELQEHISRSASEDEKLNLSDALKYIARKGNEGLIRIRSYDFDGDSDDVIGEVFDKHGDEYEFMLITQLGDVYLNVVSGRENVRAAHINDKGDLILWNDEIFRSND